MNLAWALTALCIVAVGTLLRAEQRQARRVIFIAKPIASAAFVGVALAHGIHSDHAQGIIVGLTLGLVGDLVLLGRSERALLIGLGCFLLGHLAYLAACATLLPPASWLTGAATLPMVVILCTWIWLYPRLGRLRIPVLVYMLTFAVLVSASLALWQQAPLSLVTVNSARRFALGVGLFFISDLAVARQRFVAASFKNKMWGQPLYFAGQLAIAWSLAV